MEEKKKSLFTKSYVRRFEGPDLYQTIHPHFINFHKLTVYDDYEYPKHCHDTYEIIWVENGSYSCQLNNIDLEIEEKEVLVIKPGDIHQDHLRNGQSHFVLHFTMKQSLFNPDTRPANQTGESSLPNAAWIFHELEVASQISTSLGRFTCSLQDALMEALFWQIVAILPESALSSTFRNFSLRQEFVSNLYRLFFNSLPNSLTVDHMSAKMGMSKRNLSMKCREYLNESPGKLYLQYRIDKAEKLIIQNNKSIKEISYETGFDTPFNFSRAFKRVTGTSPSKYKQQFSECNFVPETKEHL